MSKESYSIKVFSNSKDGGDGSTTTSFYGTEKEMLEEVLKQLDDGATLEDAKDAMDNDPYGFGTADTETIEITVEDGVARLSKSFSVSGGQ